jgi:pyruvate dehydrogenase E2 component (dihydrolipoamide acetyltransferase)
MGYLIRMPQMGMEMEQGEVVSWELAEGEAATVEEVVAVVESEKAANDVEAREDGVLRRILVPEGGSVEPGTPIGIFAGPDEDIGDLETEVAALDGVELSTADDGSNEAGVEGTSSSTEGSGAGAEASTAGGAAGSGASGRSAKTQSSDVRATPGARRLAEERDVALAAVTGTGPQGVVTEDDVAAHVESGADTGDAATRTVADDRELSGMQQTVGERLGESYRNAVHVTVDRSFATGTLRGVSETMQAGGVDVSLTDVLVSAVGAQLDAQPAFNALYEDGHHRLIEEVNVSVAVDVDDGLVTPVVPRASEKSVEEVAQVRRDRTDRVLAGEFDMDDLSGGTFTVSNLGPLGVDSFDPIINPPEVAILGVGRVRDDGTMTLCLSFDHRVVNGADAARFLDGLVARLTDATALLDLFAARVVPADRD